jgi:hypothetical protein
MPVITAEIPAPEANLVSIIGARLLLDLARRFTPPGS